MELLKWLEYEVMHVCMMVF